VFRDGILVRTGKSRDDAHEPKCNYGQGELTAIYIHGFLHPFLVVITVLQPQIALSSGRAYGVARMVSGAVALTNIRRFGPPNALAVDLPR
jgi:hypothetical protein